LDIVTLRNIVWRQLGAALDMLENAMQACPNTLWQDHTSQPKFWYIVYHTLFFLDFYMSDSVEDFTPPAPFTLSELDPAGILPDRVYSKKELQTYLEHGRKKCKAAIETLTDEKANRPFKYGRLDFSFADLCLYTMRHVQHHAGQLNLILRQKTDSAPRWILKTNEVNGEKKA
jgi:hypothetical protein